MDEKNFHGIDVNGEPIKSISTSDTPLKIALWIYNFIIFIIRSLLAILTTYIIGIIFPTIYNVNIFNISLNNFWIITIILFIIQLCYDYRGYFIDDIKKIKK